MPPRTWHVGDTVFLDERNDLGKYVDGTIVASDSNGKYKVQRTSGGSETWYEGHELYDPPNSHHCGEF
jgi:hypothetical protein